MDNIWMTFSVEVRDSEYSYKATNGRAQVDFVFPLDMIDSLDAGNIFRGVFKAALLEFQKERAEADSEA